MATISTKRPPFDPKTFLATIGMGRTILKFPTSAVIYAQGDAADAIYFLQKGKAKITVSAECGKEAVLSIIGANDFFGEGCLNGHPLRMAGIVAIGDCTVMRIEKAVMIAELRKDRNYRKSSSPICSTATAASKKTWSISFSIQAKNGWPAPCCCWPISARKENWSRFSPRSARRPWPR